MANKPKQSLLKTYYLEIVILVIAIVLRYIGVYPGYPPMHPDEPTSHSTAIYMLGHAYKPDRFDYPAGMAFINAVAYKVIFLPIQMTRLFVTRPEMVLSYLKLDEQSVNRSYEFLFGNRWIYAVYWTRFVHATFGWLTVALLYFVVKKLFNRPTALAASAFLAVNYRHVLGSHFGLPDVLNGFFALLALFAATLLIEKKTIHRYIFVGIAAGLSFSMKYQPFAFLPLLVSHLYWVVKEKKITNLIHPYAWLALIVAVAAFILMNPYYFPNIENAFFRNDQDIRRYQMGILELRPYGFFYLFHWGIGRLASIAVLLGALMMLPTKPLRFLLVASFAFTFILFMTIFSNGSIYPRNFGTPMPYIMIFAGYAIGMLYKRLTRLHFPYAGVIAAIVLLGINSMPLSESWNLSSNWAKPHNTRVFEQWLATTLPADINLRAYQLFLGPKGVDTLKKKRIAFRDWDYSKGPNSLAEFQEEGDDFAILQLSSFQIVTYWWRQFPKKSMFLQYSDVPYDYITNSFFGLTLREFLPYTVGEIYKPIQENDINYLMFKIPKRPQKKGKSIVQFDKEAIDTWEPLDPFGLGSGDRTFRVSSPPISVTPGKQYLISGFMKEEGNKEAIHDGYLRVDFYKYQQDYQKETMSLGVALSSRVLPNSEWTKKEFMAVAPVGAHFATVSYQRFSSQQLAYPLYVSDVEIFETEAEEEPHSEIPYIKSTIKFQNIFYRSFL